MSHRLLCDNVGIRALIHIFNVETQKDQDRQALNEMNLYEQAEKKSTVHIMDKDAQDS
jgi:hypothetical protein